MKAGFWTVASLFLFLSAVAAWGGEAPVAGEAIGQIVALQGEAEIVGSDGQIRKPALKDPVRRQDTIRTAAGRLQILFLDQTVINVGRNSEMKVSEYQFRPGAGDASMTTQVKSGVFRVLAGEIGKVAPQKFRTETPTAVIGIRGSMYAFRQQGPRLETAFLAGRGVFVASPVGTVTMTTPGFGTTVETGGAPSEPKAWPQEKLDALKGDIDPLPEERPAANAWDEGNKALGALADEPLPDASGGNGAPGGLDRQADRAQNAVIDQTTGAAQSALQDTVRNATGDRPETPVVTPPTQGGQTHPY